MGKYVMVVQSQAKEGRDAEYLDWYDRHHFDEVCAIPGIAGGRRFEFALASYGDAGRRYLSIFDVEADDPADIIAEMTRRRAAGLTSASDALDPASAVMWFYKERETLEIG